MIPSVAERTRGDSSRGRPHARMLSGFLDRTTARAADDDQPTRTPRRAHASDSRHAHRKDTTKHHLSSPGRPPGPEGRQTGARTGSRTSPTRGGVRPKPLARHFAPRRSPGETQWRSRGTA